MSAETVPAWLKGTETGGNGRSLLDFQNSVSRKQASYTIQVQICATLQEKGKMSPRVQPLATDYYPLALKPCPTGFWNYLGWVTGLPFIFFLWEWHVITVSLCLSHYLYFGSRYSAFQFHRSAGGEEICPRMDHTQSHTHTWFRCLDVEIWDFGAGEIWWFWLML